MKLKICHVITTLEMGGAQLSTLRLLRELQFSPEIDLFLIYGEEGPLSNALPLLKNITLIRLPSLQRSFHPLRDILLLFSLFKIIKTHRFDLIHTHCSKPSLFARLAAFLSGKKTIHTYHGFGHDYFKEGFFRKLFLRLENFLNRLSVRLIFVCNENLLRAKTLKLLQNQGELISDMLDFDRMLSFRKNHETGRTLGAVLSFKEQKKPFLLLNLMKKISLSFPDSHFILIGEGPLLKNAKRYAASLGLNARFTGAVTEILPYYESISLFISTSAYEGLSMAELECLYLGIPMVITPAGGIIDFMENGKQGFFYEHGNLDQALEYCHRILSGQFEYRPLSKERFACFNTKKIVERHLELYKEITDRPNT